MMDYLIYPNFNIKNLSLEIEIDKKHMAIKIILFH